MWFYPNISFGMAIRSLGEPRRTSVHQFFPFRSESVSARFQVQDNGNEVI